MADNLRQERTEEILKIHTQALSTELKGKVNIAFQDIVDRIKAKHL